MDEVATLIKASLVLLSLVWEEVEVELSVLRSVEAEGAHFEVVQPVELWLLALSQLARVVPPRHRPRRLDKLVMVRFTRLRQVALIERDLDTPLDHLWCQKPHHRVRDYLSLKPYE